jgi:hypothetical protein
VSGARRAGGPRLKSYFALLLALFATAAAGATVYVFVQSDRDGRAAAKHDATFAAKTVSKQVGDGVALLQETVQNLVSTPGIEQVYSKPADCTLTFGGTEGLGSGHIDILRSDGSVACSSRTPKGDEPLRGYAGAGWLETARSGKLLQAPVEDPATGTHAIVSAAPIEGGLVAGFLELEPAAPGLVRLYGGGRPVEFMISDGDTILARSIDPGRWVGKSLEGTGFRAAARETERRDLDGRTRLYADSAIPGTGWTLHVGEDKATALAAGNRLRNRQLAIILVGLALVILATIVIYRRVAVPVTRLGDAVRSTSGSAPLTPVPVSGPAEVKALCDDVNELIGSVNREFSERERAEESARASERNYRLLFESSPVPMWIHDEGTGSILEVNEAATTRYGYSRDEFLALTMDDLEAPGETPSHRRKDGSAIEVRAIAHPVSFGGHPARFVLAEDVGERERLEAQLRQAQRMEAIGRLAGGIAHDFNNLLTAVIGYSDLLLSRTRPGDPGRAETEQIKTAGERAAALTRQLLTLGRGQALQPGVLELNDVIEALEPMLRRLLRADVAIETSLAAEAGLVRADRGQIEQVLVNLVVNASDAMPDGGRLTIATSETYLDERYFDLHPAGGGEPGRHVLLEVSDTGVGMDQDTVAHVFEPFFTTKGEGGTGLGLATVYGIVRQSGGFIWAYSELGRGTTFKVYLPVVKEAVDAETEPISEAPVAANGRTVLLVEDDPPVRAVVRRMLDSHGFAILEAHEGDEALALSADQQPGTVDLLVTDTVLPGPGGMYLASRVRGRHPELRTLLMSGYSERDAVRDGPLEPGTEFIAKPFSAADLNAKLLALLGDDASSSVR